ncbi:hypothetical protein AcV5_005526 [Taiwanofungus camphoratus]|nr:hypothetical protein AcV5_005526 [Antrodia cinnamomea]
MAQRAWKLACERTQLNVSLTPTLLKMITSRTSHLRGELKTKAEDLKHQYGFVYADNIKRTGLYKTEILAMAISAMRFANRQDEDEWATGVKEDIPFTAASYKETYNAHLRVLRDFDDHTRKYGLLRQLREHLHRVARFHSGAEPLDKSTVPALGQAAFEAAIKEYMEFETESDLSDNDVHEDAENLDRGC